MAARIQTDARKITTTYHLLHTTHTIAPSRNQILWFGHLVGPIMRCSALIEGDFCYFISLYFPGVCQQNKGSPNIGGVLPTSEGVFSTKQGNLREIKPLFCAYAHAETRKGASDPRFGPHNGRFSPFLRFALLYLLVSPTIDHADRREHPNKTRYIACGFGGFVT